MARKPYIKKPPVRIAGPAAASVSSATSGRDKQTLAHSPEEFKRFFWAVICVRNHPIQRSASGQTTGALEINQRPCATGQSPILRKRSTL